MKVAVAVGVGVGEVSAGVHGASGQAVGVGVHGAPLGRRHCVGVGVRVGGGGMGVRVDGFGEQFLPTGQAAETD